MMEGLKTWGFSVCVAMVVCGIARLLAPKGSMQKMFGITVSAFILCSLLSPILLQKPDLKLDLGLQAQNDMESRAERLAETVGRQSKAAAAFGLEKIVAEKLEEMGINYRLITIHMNQYGQSGINVDHVEIQLEQAGGMEAGGIQRELEKELGLDVLLTGIPEGGK